MKRFEFGNINALNPNDNRKNGATFHGVIELYPDIQGMQGLCSLDICGPSGARRGSAIIDRATARKVAVALLGWAMS